MRETGYYWVMFNWPKFGRPQTHWEVASYDAEARSWAMLGSREMIPISRDREIFLEIDEREIKRELT